MIPMAWTAWAFIVVWQHMVEMMLRMRREMAGQEPQITPQIDNLLILDRTVDLLTPLLSQLTYEGLIDEIFGINNSKSGCDTSQDSGFRICNITDQFVYCFQHMPSTT